MTKTKAAYAITELGQDILNAIDDGARDIYDINVHVTRVRRSRGGHVAETHEFIRTVNELRFKARVIDTAVSPRDSRRSAYQRIA